MMKHTDRPCLHFEMAHYNGTRDYSAFISALMLGWVFATLHYGVALIFEMDTLDSLYSVALYVATMYGYRNWQLNLGTKTDVL